MINLLKGEAINGDVNIVAIGANNAGTGGQVRVFRNHNSSWVQLGNI